MAFRSNRLLMLLTGSIIGLLAANSHVAGQANSEAAGSRFPAEPLFSRHVVALFSRLGCNAGACHGAVQGQKGFGLSLFGADPIRDHERLRREFGGRRLNLADPDNSLLLLKATARIPHQGGQRVSVGSPHYRILRSWIAQGAILDDHRASRIKQLQVMPQQQTAKPGENYSLRVEATFAGGAVEDVTHLCVYESADRDVATVDANGRVEARAIGDTALVIRFRADPVLATVLVPAPGTAPFPDVKPANFIDRRVLDKLRLLGIQPSGPCDDATFLRRASLDVTGALPTPDEIRAFLADQSADKRAKKIEELLARAGYAALWATKFCDILKPTGYNANFGFTEPADARRFYEWLRARLVENLPYDQLAERILTATSREGRSKETWINEVMALAQEDAAGSAELKAYSQRKTLDLYWQRAESSGVKGTIQVAHAFLGLRLECAQCHRHPHDIWQQDDLLSFANFFTRISKASYNGSSPGMAKAAMPLTKEAATIRNQVKKLGEQAKNKKLAKEEADKLRTEAGALTIRAKAFELAAKRLKGTEIHTAVKAASASVSSPLGTQKSDQLRLLGHSRPIAVPAGNDPRAAVMAWMRRPDNPFFARAIVNRIWAHYFGRGIVDPPDHMSPLNPPSHPLLLAELADGFVKSGYDLKWVHRAILKSRTYQLSSQANAGNRNDTRNYARFYRRRLPAELLVDALDQATGSRESFPEELRLPAGARAIEVAGEVVGKKAKPGDAGKAVALAYALQIFGRPVRNPEVQCDCERDPAPTIVQMLYLANHPAVREKLAQPDGRPARILKQLAEDQRRIEEVFLWTVSRLPTDAEKKNCLNYLKASKSPRKGMEGLMWSLLNTREFVLNH